MKRSLLTAKFITIVLCLLAHVSFSQDESPLPNPTSPVMDYAGVMNSATQKRLEERIIDFKEQSNPPVELAVAIVKTTSDRPIFEYSLAVARDWRIGSRADDNPSALLFIAIDDRKYFTQVSRDLEDELPDGVVGSIQRRYLVPQFKRGNYAQGVEDTIDAYIRTIKRKQSGEPVSSTTKDGFRGYDDFADYSKSNWDGLFLCLIIIIIIIFVVMSNSGGGGGGGGRKRKSDDSSWIFFPTGSGSSDWGSSGGSSWGGGSSDWGGSSGGGWGGFGGGGDFGGGGAGGGW